MCKTKDKEQGDFNAHSEAWGYSKEDLRGKTLIDYIATNQLNIVNDSSSISTFNRDTAKGWPGITLAGHRIYNQIKDWKVIDNDIGSYHNVLTYSIDYKITIPITNRFKSKYGNHKKFSRILISKIKNMNIQETKTIDELDKVITKLIERIQEAAEDKKDLHTQTTCYMVEQGNKNTKKQNKRRPEEDTKTTG
ncbi:hypothetical protein CEXT_795191 [Caerostris extrusa]|uniref:Endonuclease/exonuclease/phosphatase domain-containing protein n=1 Tax=Caerostris extrusa TaxID=172846 RepID=A0AAV4SB60_CAEEX|nr:hypothetical protein CEXT_795191 [Caerostris extrusa]